jgi:hypothetical protein
MIMDMTLKIRPKIAMPMRMRMSMQFTALGYRRPRSAPTPAGQVQVLRMTSVILAACGFVAMPGRMSMFTTVARLPDMAVDLHAFVALPISIAMFAIVGCMIVMVVGMPATRPMVMPGLRACLAV